MNHVYFIYVAIPEKVFNKLKYMLGKTDGYRWKCNKMFGLYAWTTSKSIATEFFEVRNKYIYTVVKKDVDDDEYRHIKNEFNLLKLERRTYYLDGYNTKEKSVDIVSTKNEFICTTLDSEEYLWEFGPQIEESVPYEMFNDKIALALDTLGYSKGYDLRYGDEDKMGLASDCASYGLTPMGNREKVRYENQMNILIFLFSYFFYGENKG